MDDALNQLRQNLHVAMEAFETSCGDYWTSRKSLQEITNLTELLDDCHHTGATYQTALTQLQQHLLTLQMTDDIRSELTHIAELQTAFEQVRHVLNKIDTLRRGGSPPLK